MDKVIFFDAEGNKVSQLEAVRGVVIRDDGSEEFFIIES